MRHLFCVPLPDPGEFLQSFLFDLALQASARVGCAIDGHVEAGMMTEFDVI